MTLSQAVEVADCDVIKLIEEFLANRHLDIALMCLERESGIINGVFSEDGLFLRQLILDGHWDDVLEFLVPLDGVEGYDKTKCLHLIYKHKFLELLCIKLDPGPLQNHDFTLEEVVACLTELEQLCSDRKEYDNLCFLLTLPSITSDPAYKDWNPSSARVHCFNELYPLVRKFIGPERRPPSNTAARHDRLVNLLTKGLLYEMCVELCTARASGAAENVTVNHVLAGPPCSDADLSLLSWLQKVPSGTLAIPFEKKTLKVKNDRLDKPTLEAVWSEQLLSAPIKPKKFPHTSIPARTKSSQLISQSMMAMYDGLSSNLFSPHSLRISMTEPRVRNVSGSPFLSRSYAHAPSKQFVLTNSFSSDRRNNPMNQSMELLFSKSARSSPRPLTSSPLVKDEAKKESSSPAVISPGPAEISPAVSPKSLLPTPVSHLPSSSTNQLSHSLINPQTSTANDNLHQQRPPSSSMHRRGQTTPHHSDDIQMRRSQQTTPSSLLQATPSETPPTGLQAPPPGFQAPPTGFQALPIGIQAPPTGLQAPPTGIQAPPTGLQAPPVGSTFSVSDNERHSAGIQRQQKPDLLQHDVQGRRRSSVNEQEMVGSVRASQDLYAQYQLQKKRIEDELRQMEQRDEQWRAIHAESQVKVNDAHIPRLDLDQSESRADLSVSQLPSQDASDDLAYEINAVGDEVTIKQFVAVETLEEQAPVRAVAFHPSGECYAVGSNSKVLRVCQYPDMSNVTTSYHTATKKPKVLAKKVKHHAGSIYCVAWNTLGTVIATGSNDHTVKCVQWLSDQNVFGTDKSLSLHDGTVRDVSFLSTDQLLSAGAGDCTVCLTDIASGMVVRRYKGHEGHVLSLYTHRESQKFVSGGQDKKALMWDTRMSVPVQTYQSVGNPADSAFASVCLDPAPRVLASGHDNSFCTLYDLRQGRLLQAWRPHTDEVRSARFNSEATYFLSGSYDTTVKLMDMQGDITQPLKTVQVAEHMDKVIQCRWHPLLPSFITSSADKTVTCWAIQI